MTVSLKPKNRNSLEKDKINEVQHKSQHSGQIGNQVVAHHQHSHHVNAKITIGTRYVQNEELHTRRRVLYKVAHRTRQRVNPQARGFTEGMR